MPSKERKNSRDYSRLLTNTFVYLICIIQFNSIQFNSLLQTKSSYTSIATHIYK